MGLEGKDGRLLKVALLMFFNTNAPGQSCLVVNKETMKLVVDR